VKKSLEALGADMVLRDTDLTNRDVVRSITSHHEIRLALNCVGGKTTSNMMKLLGQNAVIVTYGAMAREPLMIPATPLIFKGLTAKGFWVSNWHQSYPEERKKELAWLCERIEKGELKDVENEEVRWGGEGVSEETAWERVQEALAKIRDGQSGKKMILVNYDPEDVKHLHSQ
jgi:mitochondrial enoyl-[acyl-carrier protein] reductase / trans-2-enoyl-CoA reductase